MKISKDELRQQAAHIRIDLPQSSQMSDTKVLKYKKAIETYPDLLNMPSAKLALLAFAYREEQKNHEWVNKNTALTNARCNAQLGRINNDKYPNDLPNLNVSNECIVCWESTRTLQMCSNCWQNIRTCLDLKGKSHREGWEGWGLEMSLDLAPLVRLLKENGKPILS